MTKEKSFSLRRELQTLVALTTKFTTKKWAILTCQNDQIFM